MFDQIKKIQPKYLYVAADGPRNNKPGEERLCNDSRAIVLEGIGWDCEVKTLLREKNVGCKEAVSQAIAWFFNNVEQGIILEDDCLPGETFFNYCEELLEKYKIFTGEAKPNTIRLLPALNISTTEADLFLDSFAAILNS